MQGCESLVGPPTMGDLDQLIRRSGHPGQEHVQLHALGLRLVRKGAPESWSAHQVRDFVSEPFLWIATVGLPQLVRAGAVTEKLNLLLPFPSHARQR
eukprot:5321372-Pyramimonas_sp.AAC.1